MPLFDFMKAKFRNQKLSIEERVEDLLSRMSMEEKVAQMQCITFDFSFAEADFGKINKHIFTPEEVVHGMGQIALGSFKRRPRENAEYCNQIQKMFITESRLGIPVIFHEEGLHGHDALEGTSFPSPLAMAGTWNPELVNTVTTLIAEEIRVRGGHLVLTPVLDLARDPRWGRTEETFGEDPYLVSRMGVASITGFQGKNAPLIDKKHVASTMKHFAAHGNPESGINISPPHADDDLLFNFLLQPFQAAVQQARVMAVMASYNEINGIPVHAHKRLLREILREKWGFRGITVSDWFAIEQLIDTHFIAQDEKEAAFLAVTAGMDIELPLRRIYKKLIELVKEKRIPESLIDQSVQRLLTMKFQLGLFEDPYVNPEEAERVVGNSLRRNLACTVAEEAITLLKNENNLLPLDLKKYKKIAVIGPLADTCVIGNYSKEPKQRITILSGIKAKVGNTVEVLYHQGVKLTKDFPTDNTMSVRLEDDDRNRERIQEAVKIARDSEIILLCLGTHENMMREGWATNRRGDNASLELRSLQNELVAEMGKLGKPIVVLLFSGGPLAFEYIKETVPAIFQCWYLGQETGFAVANILFGEVSPSGKLPITIPRSSGQLPVFYNRKPSSRIRGYLFDDSTPLYPFGYGLSYTTFEYQNLNLSKEAIGRDEYLEVTVEVTNTGNREGKEIVQLYIRDKVSSRTRPIKELKDFKKISLKSGETKSLHFLVTPDKLGFYNANNVFVVELGEFEVMVGRSSEDYLTERFTVIENI